MRPVRILLVEDNPGDADLTRDAFETSNLANSVEVVVDGAEALAFLLQKPPYTAAARPDLVLLDLNVPKVDGRQVLAEMRKHDGLRQVPVVILTSSDAERDIVESYRLGANCYVTKPVNLEAFQTMLRSVEEFWFGVVKLP